MGMSTENNFQLSIQAKAKGFNLRVRLKGTFFTSQILKARHLSGSLSARARGLTLYFKLGLLQALGAAAPTSNSANVVRYSLRMHVRKLWMKMKGNYTQGDQRELAPKTKSSSEKTPLLKKRIASHKKTFIYRLFPGKKNTETKTVVEVCVSDTLHLSFIVICQSVFNVNGYYLRLSVCPHKFQYNCATADPEINIGYSEDCLFKSLCHLIECGRMYLRIRTMRDLKWV